MRAITIAGGGLAGLSLGIALRHRGVPVVLLESASYPRHRVCGEFISGITPAELDCLGISDLFEPAHRSRTTAWFDGSGTLMRQTLSEDASCVSRNYLDAALAERFCSLGGELHTGQRHTVDAPGTVWACGRMRAASPWMGLKAHFLDLSLDADLEVHLADTAYLGLTQVEDGFVNVCGLFRRSEAIPTSDDASPLHAATRLAGLDRLADRLAAAKIVPASVKGVTHLSLGWQVKRPGALCIGDAAVMIPPFTGNGMTMAFQSTISAIEPIMAWSAGHADWVQTADSVHQLQRSAFGSRILWARMIQAVLMRRTPRRIVGSLLRHGLLPFDTIYDRLR